MDQPLLLPVQHAPSSSKHHTWVTETAGLARLATPLAIAEVLGYINIMMQVAYVGDLGPVQQGGWYLARMYYCLCGLGALMGLAGALETFAGQAWGSRQPRMLGWYLQRALLVTLVAWALCCIMYIKAPLMLRLMHQDPLVIQIAADYCMRYIPSLLAAGVGECVKRFMVAQNLGTPVMLATLLPTLAAPPTLWLLVRHWQWGLSGVAIATAVWHVEALLLMVGCMALVESGRGTSQRTWHGFSLACVTNPGWAPYLAVAGPSCLLLTLDWGIGEAAGFLAGLLPNSDIALSVFGISNDMINVISMSCYALAAAVAARVANHLGAGSDIRASLTTRVALVLSAGLGGIAAVGLIVLRGWYVPWYTEDVHVRRHTAHAMVPGSLSLLGNSVYLTLSGVLRGAGRQHTAAGAYLLAAYAVGIPLEVWFAFTLTMGVNGIWWAQTSTAILMVLVMGVMVARLDWRAESAAACARLHHVDHGHGYVDQGRHGCVDQGRHGCVDQGRHGCVDQGRHGCVDQGRHGCVNQGHHGCVDQGHCEEQ